MSYSDWRKRLIQGKYNATINEFANGYKLGKPTVVLLPGGMGSQLDRSVEPYQGHQLPPSDYETVWLDDGIFDGEGRSLLIDTNGRDRDRHVIVPNGPLRYYVYPYSGTQTFFEQRDINYVVFAYDWRRSIDESAAFLKYFLKRLKHRVYEKKNEDPSPNLTLLAHSQGGLVAKMFLHQGIAHIEEWMKQLITVATPFYGTWSQQQRYFVGQQFLSSTYRQSETASIIATMPGLYNLMFLPRPTFDQYGKELGLQRYPIRHPAGGDGPDPYDEANHERYPQWVSLRHLRNARQNCQILAAPFSNGVENRVYNIRAVDRATPVELVWDELPGDFNPDEDESPVREKKSGRGDGTVPAWSAYHVSVPSENKREVDDIPDDEDPIYVNEHMYLMDDAQVLEQVYEWVNARPISRAKQSRDATTKVAKAEAEAKAGASTEEVKELCDDIAAGKVRRNSPSLSDPRIRRGIYRELTR